MYEEIRPRNSDGQRRGELVGDYERRRRNGTLPSSNKPTNRSRSLHGTYTKEPYKEASFLSRVDKIVLGTFPLIPLLMLTGDMRLPITYGATYLAYAIRTAWNITDQ